MKQRVYLDTSVISALHDSSARLRQEQTVRFWDRLASVDVMTSEVTRIEIEQTPDVPKRARMLESLGAVRVFPLSDPMRRLAQAFLEARVFTGRMENDALHVAAAVIDRCDIVLSWNFKHLVNRWRRAAVNAVNAASGLPTIDIIAPPEI